MAIRNRYNDPALGAAFENIASLFAPVSANELAGYATADLTRQRAAAEAQRMGLVDLFTQGGDDRIGVAAGLYAPTQSYQALQMGDATARRGQDMSSADARYGHELGLHGTQYTSDNALKGAIFGHSSAPLAQGEVRNVDPAIVEWATGIPGLGINQAGAPKPLTDAEVKGQALLDADPAFRQWVAGGSKDPIAVLGPEGPVMLAPDQAAGMGVYDKPTAAGAPKLTNARLPDGTQTTALETPQGLVDPQTGQPLPPGTTMFSTAAQGSADEVGLGTAVRNRVDTQGMAAVSALDTIGQLEALITANPASQGVVGSLRGSAQNLIQSGNELGRFLGGAAAEAAEAAGEGLIDAGIASEMFDPSIPAIDMLMNALAWQYAKGQAGDRVSNEQLRIARDAIGSSGLFNNQANSLTRLDQMRQMFMRDLNRYGPALSPEVQVMAQPYWTPQGAAAPAAAPPPSTPAVPAVGTVEDGYRFLGGNPSDPASWEPVQ